VKDWPGSQTAVASLSTDAPGYHITDTYTGIYDFKFFDHVITNAYAGALFSWQAVPRCYSNQVINERTIVQTDPCPTQENHLSMMSSDGITSDVRWAEDEEYGMPVEPTIQLDDDAFAGVATTSSGNRLLIFDALGQIRWTGPDQGPVMVTPGGFIANNGTSYTSYDKRLLRNN
jgi:hypothetical protein